ncbi:O-Antigen ligase [Pseudoalteromonas sp. P1-30]|uniref:O-antigen ligase family protein n=1 Tax=Pseudoalteromonas sp. P1-30 TaxID=1723760 RepID=UPI0006D60E3C|nr:O-antigen ligase family protein [Pseudoalteromonas sp. P1-30]KPV91508.1 O-Antigen ligase [Pseudoalteromonas sp. P1-30]
MNIHNHFSKIYFYLLPVWLLGVSFFYFHLIVFYILLTNVSVIKRLSIPAVIVFFFCLAYLFSLGVSFFTLDYEVQRYISSLYNWSYWIIAFTILAFFKSKTNIERLDTKQLAKGAKFFILTTFFVCFSSLFLTGTAGGSLHSALGVLLPEKLPPLILDSTALKFYVGDWINGESTVRYSGFGIYPTAAAWITFLAVCCLYMFDRKSSLSVFVLFSVIALIVVFMTASRIVLLALMVFYILQLVKPFILSSKGNIFIFFSISLFLLLIMLFIATGALDSTLNARQGSTDLRFLLYKVSFWEVVNANPILGVGVKPRLDGWDIPLGSHNTFLGVFVRTGIIGFLIVLTFFIYILFYFILNMRKGGFDGMALILTNLPILIFEDLDAPQSVCFVFFMLVSVSLFKVKSWGYKSNF